jgi:hypothetical protein
LIICVNGKIEKVASGLVQPFLDHLKTAQDQVAKGGYSIILEPGSDATWFTKGTPQLPLLNITYCCFSGGSEY